jgi:hypothetical protein
MPRYVVERDFPTGFRPPEQERGVLELIEVNRMEDVNWVHSYVSVDRKKTFCVYDAPSPEAIRRANQRSRLPLTCITEVRMFDPYSLR